MALNTGIALIDGLSTIGIKDILDWQAARNQQKIDTGLADTSNYVASLNAQSAMLKSQAAAALAMQQENAANSTFGGKGLLIAGLAVAAGVAIWLFKK